MKLGHHVIAFITVAIVKHASVFLVVHITFSVRVDFVVARYPKLVNSLLLFGVVGGLLLRRRLEDGLFEETHRDLGFEATDTRLRLAELCGVLLLQVSQEGIETWLGLALLGLPGQVLPG